MLILLVGGFAFAAQGHGFDTHAEAIAAGERLAEQLTAEFEATIEADQDAEFAAERESDTVTRDAWYRQHQIGDDSQPLNSVKELTKQVVPVASAW